MRERLARFKPDLLVAIVLFAVPLVFFWQQTLGGRTLLPVDNLFQFQPYAALREQYSVGTPQNALLSDLILQNVAWKQFALDQFHAGQIPLWQPNIAGGAPFIGAGQSGVLYPFSIIYALFPLPAAYGWFTVSQLWLAGLFMYVLARVLGLRRSSALIAALVYQFSGFMLVSVVFPMIISTAAWLPLEIAMIELIIRQERALGGRPATIPWVVLGGIGLGMAALAGHAEALYFTLLVMGFYAAWRLLAGVLAHREAGRWKALLRRSAWLLTLVALGLALGAAQIIPAAELVSRSFREGSNTLEQVRSYAFPLRHVLLFLMPNFYGNPAHHAYLDLFTGRMTPVTVNALGDPINNTAWGIKNYVEGGTYLGLPPLLLAGLALLHWIAGRAGRADRTLGGEQPGRPYRTIFGGLALLSLSFIFGSPTYALLYYGLPFINQSHSPFRWVWPLTLCVAVLAGFGADLLHRATEAKDTPEGARIHKSARLLGWIVLTIGAAALFGLLLSRAAYSSIEPLVQRVFEGLALAPNAFANSHAFYSYTFWNVLGFALVLSASGAVLLISTPGGLLPAFVPVLGGRRIRLWEPLAALLIALDLALPLIGFHPAADPKLLAVVPESIAWLKGQQSETQPWRFIPYEEPGADTMNANIGWLHRLEDAAGYDSLIPGAYADMMQIIQPQGDLAYNRIAPLYSIYPGNLDSPILDLLTVKYVVSEVPIDSPRFVEAYRDDAVRIYENLGVMPRAFTLPVSSTVISAADDASEGFALLAQSVDFRQHVVVNTHSSPFNVVPADPPIAAQAQAAAITIYTPNEMWIDVDTSEASWLVVADGYFPGWRAFARPVGAGDATEQEIAVWRVNGALRGMVLEPGRWTVRLSYSPDSIRFGGFVSFIALMAMIFAVGVWAWRYAYQESADTSTARRIAKNSITPIILNLFNRGIQFAFAFVSLRILGPEGSGRYQYAVLIFGWFEILSNFGLDTLLMREVSRNREEANRWLVNTSLIRLAIAVVGAPLLAGFITARNAALPIPLAPETVAAMWLLYIGLFLSTLNKGLTGLFYAYEKAEYPSALQTVSTMLVAVLGVIVLLLGYGIVGLAGVSIIVNAITLAALYTLTTRLFFPPRLAFDRSLQRGALNESFPLMVNHLLATVFFRIDIILLEALTNDTVVGWYGVVYKWIDAINVIPSFFTQALFPVMSRQAHEDRVALKRSYIFSVKLLTLISLPGAVVTTLLAYALVGLLGGEQFLPAGAVALQVFVWSIPFGWINSVTNYLIIALNRQRVLTWAFIFGAVFNITVNLILIPRYSFVAAAVTTILSEFVLLAFFYLVLIGPLGPINWARILWRIAAAAGLMGTVAYLLAPVNLPVALAGSVIVYTGAIVLLKPFDADERARLAGLLPARFRPAETE
ncbi:MAG: oligosaccharide flippase family protein [Anaerolineae bacterium]|nr:oligosaccharide flippase family protein [Anaerolineae bacterium]